MRLGYYTYGDHQMGLGHVYRCLAIDRALRALWPEAQSTFELKDQPEGVRVAKEAGAEVRVWAAGEVPKPDQGWDLLVVDQLDVPASEMRRLKAQTRCLVSLDDKGEGRYEADLAVNALYQSRVERPAASAAKTFEGLEYLLIDERFSKQGRPEGPEMKNVLVSQGGADTYGLVPPIINRLAPWALQHGITLHALVGPAFRHEVELGDVVFAFPKTVRVQRGLRDLPLFFAGLDAAVSGAGLTACELASAGVPTLLITGEKKELETAEALAKAEAAEDFGAYSTEALERLAQRLDEHRADVAARRGLSVQAKKAIDGKGMSRLTALIQGALTP